MQPSREERAAKEAGERGRRNGTVGKGAAVLGADRDHINALGLPNDGYDYEQHFKSMGVCGFVDFVRRI